MTSTEQEWDTRQRELMLGLAVIEEQTCGGCGGLLPVTTDPASEDAYQIDDPVRCHKCTAIARKAQVYHEEARHPHALRFPIAAGPADTVTPAPVAKPAGDEPDPQQIRQLLTVFGVPVHDH